MDAVVAACRSESKAFGASFGHRVDQMLCRVAIDLHGEFGIALANRIAHQRGEQDDVRHPVQRVLEDLAITEIVVDEREIGLVEVMLKRVAIVVDQMVEHANLGARLHHLADEDRADIARPTNH